MDPLFNKTREIRWSPLRITLLYILVFAAWILFSDQMLTVLTTDPAMLTHLQTVKGWLFVLGTALLIHHLLKKFKEAYEDKLAVFTGLFEQSAFPMFLIDPGTQTIVACNRAAEKFYGYPREKLSSMPLVELNRDGSDAVRERVTGILDGGPNVFLLEHRMADGSMRTVRIYSSSVSIGGQTLVTSLIADVTETERKDAEIRRLSRQIAGLLDSTTTPACLVDQEAHVLLANKAMARVAGRPAPGMRGLPLRDILGRKESTGMAQAVQQALSSGAVQETEIVLSLDGVETVYKAVSFPILDESGRVESAGMVAMDLTREKQAEAALLQAKEQAEAASRSKSVFLANMSHELRTPLSGILGMLHLLGTTTLSSEQQEYAEAAVTSCHGLTHLLEDILELSRIEADMERPRPEPLDPRELVVDLTALFTGTAGEAGLALHANVSPDLPDRLLADTGKLRQIIINLLGNAIKFTQKGQVELDIRPLLATSRPRLLITVSDTGIGIPDDKLKDLFQPFAQVESTFTRSFRGAGLGLAIVRRLTVMLGGEACVDSVEGEGTSVYVCLPLVVPPAAVATPAEAKPQAAATETQKQPDRQATGAASPGRRILVVEDDMINQMAMNMVLSQSGFNVVCANNGREAVETFKPGEFAAVLMDIQMPVMNGIEATQRIRAIEEGTGQRTPIIAVSAYALPGERKEILDSGLDMHISKPVDFDQLVRIILGEDDRAANVTP